MTTLSTKSNSSDILFIDDTDMSRKSTAISKSAIETMADLPGNPVSTCVKGGNASTSEPRSLPSITSSHQKSPLKSIEIPCIILPSDVQFIDGSNLAGGCSLGSNKSPRQESETVFHIPNVTLPPHIQCIDDSGLPFQPYPRKFHRGEKTHSSLRIPRRPSRRRLCRHHSDSEAKNNEKVPPKQKAAEASSRRIRRSVSAIETNKSRYKPHVRRSISDRSTLLMAGKHLVPPRNKSRPHSMAESHSSRCSSTKTLSSKVSLSEIVAVELGYMDIPGLTAKEARRRRVVCTVMVIFITILLLSVLLVAVTLMLSPAVDEILRKGNEEIYRSMSAGASTSSPTTEDAVVANNSTPPSGTPG